MSQKESAIIERAVIYLEKELEGGLGMRVKTEYHSPLYATIELDDRIVRISTHQVGSLQKYNLILGLKEVKKVNVVNDEHIYMFPMRMIDGLVAKISYDNKVRRGEISND